LAAKYDRVSKELCCPEYLLQVWKRGGTLVYEKYLDF